jgi:insecticidal toxin complex protein TccC
VFELAKDFVGVLGKAKNAADQIHNLATEFDGLVPEDADIAEVRQNMTLGKFLLSKHGVKSILKGAIAGSTVASAIGSVVPGVGTGIGAAIGMVVGAIAMPLLRYYFFKKGLKLAETLHTQEIKNGLNTAVDTTNKVIDGAKSIANGGRDVIDRIKNSNDTINAYSEEMQKIFYNHLKELPNERQRDVIELLNSGIDPFVAITQVVKTAQTIVEGPTEAAGASQRLAQLADEVANPVSERPIPKPRKLIQKLQRRNSESIA